MAYSFEQALRDNLIIDLSPMLTLTWGYMPKMVVPRCSSDAYTRFGCRRLWGDHAAMIVYPTNIRYIGKSSQLREPLRYEDDLGEEEGVRRTRLCTLKSNLSLGT